MGTDIEACTNWYVWPHIITSESGNLAFDKKCEQKVEKPDMVLGLLVYRLENSHINLLKLTNKCELLWVKCSSEACIMFFGLEFCYLLGNIF